MQLSNQQFGRRSVPVYRINLFTQEGGQHHLCLFGGARYSAQTSLIFLKNWLVMTTGYDFISLF
jgi:hypothetical protein